MGNFDLKGLMASKSQVSTKNQNHIFLPEIKYSVVVEAYARLARALRMRHMKKLDGIDD